MGYIATLLDIFRGTSANDGTGTDAREAGSIINDNFHLVNEALEELDGKAAAARSYADLRIGEEISDVNVSLQTLENYVDGAFKDGVLSEAEIKDLEKWITSLDSEKEDVIEKYNIILLSEFLPEMEGLILTDKKEDYDAAHEALTTNLRAVIGAGGGDYAENLFSDYRTTLVALNLGMESALQEIEEARIDSITDEKIGNIEIGGRNLASQGSIILQNAILHSNDDYTYDFTAGRNQGLHISNDWIKGQVYTLSYFVKIVSGTLINLGGNSRYKDEKYLVDGVKPTNISSYHNGYEGFPTDGEFHKVEYTFRVPDYDVPAPHEIGIEPNRYDDTGATARLVVKEIKLEKGNKATDWTPAPEDVNSAMEAVATAKAELAETQAKGYADGKVDAEEARAIADAQAKYEAALGHAQDLVDEINIGARNLVPTDSITVEDATLNSKSGNVYDFTAGRNQGLRIGHQFIYNEIYTLSYYAKYVSGTLVNLGGHSRHSDIKITIDDMVVGGYHSGLSEFPDDGEFHKVEYTFKFTSPSSSGAYEIGIEPNRYDDTGATARLVVKEIKLEKGNKATDWTPYIPDNLEQQIAELENVKSTTETLSQKTNHLETDVNGNVITTGTVAIGNASEQNGGMTGLDDKGSKSVRLWQGASFAGRYNAPFRVLDDGTVQTSNSLNQWFYPNGELAMEQGIKDGKPAFNIYSEDGQLIVFLGAGGITFGDYIPESWPEANFYRLSTAASPSDSTLLTAFKALLRKSVITSSNEDDPNRPHNTIDGWTTYAVDKQGTITTGYRYNAGVGLDSDERVQYEGYIYASKSYAPGNYFADGWYVTTARPQTGIIYHGQYDTDGDGYPENHTGQFTSEAVVFKIQGGVTVETRRIAFTQNVLTLPNL